MQISINFEFSKTNLIKQYFSHSYFYKTEARNSSVGLENYELLSICISTQRKATGNQVGEKHKVSRLPPLRILLRHLNLSLQFLASWPTIPRKCFILETYYLAFTHNRPVYRTGSLRKTEVAIQLKSEHNTIMNVFF